MQKTADRYVADEGERGADVDVAVDLQSIGHGVRAWRQLLRGHGQGGGNGRANKERRRASGARNRIAVGVRHRHFNGVLSQREAGGVDGSQIHLDDGVLHRELHGHGGGGEQLLAHGIGDDERRQVVLGAVDGVDQRGRDAHRRTRVGERRSGRDAGHRHELGPRLEGAVSRLDDLGETVGRRLYLEIESGQVGGGRLGERGDDAGGDLARIERYGGLIERAGHVSRQPEQTEIVGGRLIAGVLHDDAEVLRHVGLGRLTGGRERHGQVVFLEGDDVSGEVIEDVAEAHDGGLDVGRVLGVRQRLRRGRQRRRELGEGRIDGKKAENALQAGEGLGLGDRIGRA